jgi:hypothetical protein
MDDINDLIAQTLDQVTRVLDRLPEDIPHTASRNRLHKAAIHLEDARDSVNAAKARLPQDRA